MTSPRLRTGWNPRRSSSARSRRVWWPAASPGPIVVANASTLGNVPRLEVGEGLEQEPLQRADRVGIVEECAGDERAVRTWAGRSGASARAGTPTPDRTAASRGMRRRRAGSGPRTRAPPRMPRPTGPCRPGCSPSSATARRCSRRSRPGGRRAPRRSGRRHGSPLADSAHTRMIRPRSGVSIASGRGLLGSAPVPHVSSRSGGSQITPDPDGSNDGNARGRVLGRAHILRCEPPCVRVWRGFSLAGSQRNFWHGTLGP